MSTAESEWWPWLALAGLGAFHGLNPAMGWLFAVALGLHRHSRRLIWLSPLPIAFGHAVSIAVVAGAFVLAGLAIDLRALRIGAGLMLWPVLMPLCFSTGSQPFSIGPLPTALLGIAVHTLAMLTVTTAVAVAVYEWIGLEILRRAWLNVDLIWTFAILVAGGLLLL